MSATPSRHSARSGHGWKILPVAGAWRGGICKPQAARAGQYDSLEGLPERPPAIVQPPATDAIADKIEDLNPVTGSIPALMGQR